MSCGSQTQRNRGRLLCDSIYKLQYCFKELVASKRCKDHGIVKVEGRRRTIEAEEDVEEDEGEVEDNLMAADLRMYRTSAKSCPAASFPSY